MLMLLADSALGSTFGGRDLAGLLFVAVAIALIWVGFQRELNEPKAPIHPPAK